MNEKHLIGAAALATIGLIAYAKWDAKASAPDSVSSAPAGVKAILKAAVKDAATGQISKLVVDGKSYYAIVPNAGAPVSIYDAAGKAVTGCSASIAPAQRTDFCKKILAAEPVIVYRSSSFYGQQPVIYDEGKVNFTGNVGL